MTDYHSPQGCEATPKPLARYRDRLCWDDPTEARKDFYGEVRWEWVTKKRRPDLYHRHEHQIVAIALRELAKAHQEAA